MSAMVVGRRMLPWVVVCRKLSLSHRRAGAAGWRSGPAPLLTVTPSRVLMDEQVSIRGSFLPPHFPVTLRSRMLSEDGDLWEAFAHYTTDGEGAVNASRDPSVGGSYLGREPMGLFWGLQPAPGSREGLRLRKKNVETPYVVNVSLLGGHVAADGGSGEELAAAAVERWYMAPGVKRKDVRQDGLVGTLFLPPGPGKFPAVLDLWGMGGGLVEYRSALLASRGYASFSLAYLGHKELPSPLNRISVGDSYFKNAFRVLQDHRQVCGDRIGIVGLSFGVYLTLRLVTSNAAQASCVICINGPVGSTIKLSDVDGETDVFERDQRYWTYDQHGNVSFRAVSLPANLQPESKLKIENLACPIMYILGEDDLSSSSAENADVIEDTLTAAGKSHLLTRLSYPGAGHLIEPPYSPNARVSLWSVKPRKVFCLWGGRPAPHAAAQEDAWKKILDYLEKHLRR